MSVQSSKYSIFKIISADGKNEVDFAQGQFRIANFYYYENVLSPFITGIVTIVSTSAVTKSKDDTQERVGSLHTSLPLEVGCELLVKIEDPIGEGLDFSSKKDPFKKLYVNEVQIIDKKSTSEIIQIRFISRIGLVNNTKRLTKHYTGKITDSIGQILKNEFKLDKDRINIDDCSNPYSFAGMTKRPFDLILMLAKQSVPENTSNPGYFAYETKSGFNYVSVDSIINNDPYDKVYHYDGKVEASSQTRNDSNDYKISSLQVVKDQNLMSQIRSGVYANKTIFFNPQNFQFTEVNVTVDDGRLYKDPKFSTLGKTPGVPKVLEDDFEKGNKFHRVQTAVLNIGAEKESINPNNSPELYYAAGTTRYNMLFSQKHSITIPCNTDLEAGDTLRVEIEDITDNKEQGPDQKQSGVYIISSLCHYFESEKSVTSLTLIRDSYGLHASKNPSKSNATAKFSNRRRNRRGGRR